MIHSVEKALLKLKNEYIEGKVSREDYLINLRGLAVLYISDEEINRVETKIQLKVKQA